MHNDVDNTRKRFRKITSDWSRNSILKLIEIIQNKKQLWDISHADYKNRNMRSKIMEEIASALNKEVEDVTTKWQNLRSQYNAERRKVSKIKGGQGADGVHVKWQYYSALDFLSAQVEESESFSTSFMDFHDSPLPQTSKRIKIDIESTPKQIKSGIESTSKQIKSGIESTSKQIKSGIGSTSKQMKSGTESASKQMKSGTESASKQINSDIERNNLMKKAAELLCKPTDGAQIFGDYLAQRLREFPPHISRKLRCKIEIVISEASIEAIEYEGE